MSATEWSFPLHALPPNAFQHLVLLLPDPGPLAATCRGSALQLDSQALQLEWADVWAERLAGDGAEHRHAAYALLNWQRLRGLGMKQLVPVLQLWMKRRQIPPAPDRLQRVKQVLDSGDGLAALRALLPHSQHLLLLHAAQAGHMPLLTQLLAQHDVAVPVQLQWGNKEATRCCLLLPATLAAVRGGHLRAMHLLLTAVAASSVCTSNRQLNEFHFFLLTEAIRSGKRSTSCVQALLWLCGYKLPFFMSEWCMPPPVHTDSTAVAMLLEAVAACDPVEAYDAAVWSGQLQQLPAWVLHMGWGDAKAAWACVHARKSLSSEQPAQLRHVAECMVAVVAAGRVAVHAAEPIRAALVLNSVAALEAMWAAFATPAVPASARETLASLVLSTLGLAMAGAYLESQTLDWVTSHVLPLVHGMALGAAVVQQAACECLRFGQLDWLAALQDPDVTAALVNEQPEWQRTCLVGQVYMAARRGDAAGVGAAVQALQAHVTAAPGTEHDFYELGAVDHAILLAARLPDAEAAAAVVHTLAPLLGENSRNRSLLTLTELATAHGGALLRLLCDGSPFARSCLIGPDVEDDWCHIACEEGHTELALWLIAHPEQHELFLSGTLCQYDEELWPTCFSFTPRVSSSFAQLLRSLVRWQSTSATGESAGDAAGSSGISAPMLPPGARSLTSRSLRAVAHLGSPELMHALLDFMEAWSPAAAVAGSCTSGEA